MDLAGGVAGFIGRQIDGQHGDFFGGAETAHRLAVDKGLPRGLDAGLVQLGQIFDALVERG